MEHAVKIKKEIIQLAGKAGDRDKYIPKQDLWLYKLTEIINEILQEVDFYKLG